MAGLIGVGRNTLGQASVGFQQSAGLEANRNAAQQQLNAARAAQRSSMVATGAGLGGSIGVNNLMAAQAAAKGVPTAALAGQTAAATGSVTGSAGTGALFGVSGSGAPMSLAALEAGTAAAGTAAAGTAAGTTAGTVAGTVAAAPVAAAPVAGASTGAMATIGAIATPLLIGAGAALLLDSMFDIF
jgi:hypothetical protein